MPRIVKIKAEDKELGRSYNGLCLENIPLEYVENTCRRNLIFIDDIYYTRGMGFDRINLRSKEVCLCGANYSHERYLSRCSRRLVSVLDNKTLIVTGVPGRIKAHAENSKSNKRKYI